MGSTGPEGPLSRAGHLALRTYCRTTYVHKYEPKVIQIPLFDHYEVKWGQKGQILKFKTFD